MRNQIGLQAISNPFTAYQTSLDDQKDHGTNKVAWEPSQRAKEVMVGPTE